MSLRGDRARSASSSADPDLPHAGWARLQKILVATDGSAWSSDAIELAAEMAAKHHSELTFVHVLPALDLVPASAVDGIGAALPHEPTEHDHALLADAAAVAAAHGLAARTALLAGSIADEIVAYGESTGVDVIVVGSRGHGAVASALLGSVALGVLRTSSRAVLIVRGATWPHPPRGGAGGAA